MITDGFDLFTQDSILCIIYKFEEIYFMMKTAVVTDSNSGISPEEAKANGIDVISMPFRIGERE